MENQKKFPRMLSLVLISLSIIFFIPDVIFHKIIQIGPFQESAAIFFFPFIFPIADALTEVYGKKEAEFVLMSCYLVTFIVSMFVRLVVMIPSPPGWSNQEGFSYIFSQGPKIVLIGFLGFSVSMLMNIWMMDKLRWKMRGKHFIVRSIVSSSIGEFVVTLFYPLAFSERGYDLLILMASAYGFKVIFSIIGSFPSKLIVFLLRYVDGIEEISYHEGFHVLEKETLELGSG